MTTTMTMMSAIRTKSIPSPIEASARRAPRRPLASPSRWPVPAGAALVLALAGTLAAQEYRAEAVSAAPPEAVPAAARALLAENAIRVSGPEGAFAEIWLRKTIPVKGEAAQALGIAYPRFIAGTLVGTVRFAAEARDYRGQRIQPGAYTLRYLLHPVDGNHMGVAPQRDFLLLAPAAEDQKPDPLSYDALVALSVKASGTAHAAVFSLPYPEDRPDSFPALIHWEDEGLWLLYARVTLQPEGGEATEAPLALVIIGQAPEA